MQPYSYFFWISFGTAMYFCELPKGISGIKPALANKNRTLSEGWAPTDIQYFTLSEFAVISLIPSSPGIGL